MGPRVYRLCTLFLVLIEIGELSLEIQFGANQRFARAGETRRQQSQPDRQKDSQPGNGFGKRQEHVPICVRFHFPFIICP